MHQPSLPDLNPYETPGIERLHHTSVYVWPLSADKRLSFSVQIDEDQLTKCVEANSRFVNPYFWTSLFCFFAFMITGLIWLASSDFDFMLISICTIAFLSLFFVVPRCFSRWHVRRAGQRFKWLWGDVRGEISIHGLNWRSDTVELQLPWDSFHTVVWEPSCVWLSTQYPFPIDFPLHRDWFDITTWQEIREVNLAHAGIFVRENFWRYSRPQHVSFEEAATPNIKTLSDKGVPFRAQSFSHRYGSERIVAFLKRSGNVFVVLPLMIFLVTFVPAFQEWDDQQLGLRKDGRLIYVFYAMVFCSSMIPMMRQWFPAGTGIHQWSQLLLSSQSGFVSRQQICIASPACTMTAKLVGETSVRLEKNFLVLSFQREFRQSLVIPRDQFCENDADKAWELFGEEITG